MEFKITTEMRNDFLFLYNNHYAWSICLHALELHLFEQKYGRQMEIVELWGDVDADIREAAKEFAQKIIYTGVVQ